MNLYQKCPSCGGTGNDYMIIQINQHNPCKVCDGRLIVSVLNGKPPKK